MRALLSPIAVVLLVCPLALGNSNPLTADCPSGPGEAGRGCRTVDAFVDGSARLCRNAGASPSCDGVDFEPVASARVDAYLLSETHLLLDARFHAQDGLPLREATIVSTHNTFNAEAYAPTVSGLDANQRYSIYDQLRMDVRMIELDAHWWPSLAASGIAPVMCHAEDAGGGVHAGCTTERLLDDGLAELRRFLDEERDEVVILYVEDHLDGADGSDRGATALAAALGGRIHPPTPGAGCAAGLPLDLTRAEVLAAGHQVLVVGSCGAGSAWPTLVHDYGASISQGSVSDFRSAPCGGDDHGGRLSRFYEDRTWLSFMASPQIALTPEDARQMAACRVNFIGLDLLAPEDGRLVAIAGS